MNYNIEKTESLKKLLKIKTNDNREKTESLKTNYNEEKTQSLKKILKINTNNNEKKTQSLKKILKIKTDKPTIENNKKYCSSTIYNSPDSKDLPLPDFDEDYFS